MNFDGTDMMNVFTGGSGPLKLAKDMSTGIIYFTNFAGTNLSTVMPDGTGYTVLSSAFDKPGGVFLDAESGKLI